MPGTRQRPPTSTRPRSRARVVPVASVVIALAVVLAACSDDSDGAATTTTTIPATTTTAPTRPDDGRLVVGVLLPTSGPAAALLGDGMVEAIELAEQRIDAAGGVIGEEIGLVVLDEGESTTSARLGLERLIEQGVDAIIGPSSSTNALATLDVPVSAGVLTCSPTATALALDDFPDAGLFFRTVPSDSLQAVGLAELAEQTGATSVAVAFVDDVYGRGLARAFRDAVENRALDVVAEVGFRTDDASLGDDAARLLAGEPGVVVVLADAIGGAQMLAAIDQASGVEPVPPLLVNDGLRNDVAEPVIAALSTRVRDAVAGIAPLAAPESPEDPELAAPYAAMAFDCLNLIALAAVQAGSDDPARMSTQLASVSVGGSRCRSYQSCLDAIERDLQIDYAGPSGNTDLSNRTGDPTSAQFQRFAFERDGNSASVGAPFEVSVD